MKRITLCICIVLTMAFLLTACGQKNNDDVVIDYGSSEIYTKEDMDEAIELIREQFKSFEGCELHSIRYGSDDCNSEENIKWMNEHEEGQNFTQCIMFYSDFHSPVEGGDEWEPDYEYKDWNWYLARTDGGEWHLLDWGY